MQIRWDDVFTCSSRKAARFSVWGKDIRRFVGFATNSKHVCAKNTSGIKKFVCGKRKLIVQFSKIAHDCIDSANLNLNLSNNSVIFCVWHIIHKSFCLLVYLCIHLFVCFIRYKNILKSLWKLETFSHQQENETLRKVSQFTHRKRYFRKIRVTRNYRRGGTKNGRILGRRSTTCWKECSPMQNAVSLICVTTWRP